MDLCVNQVVSNPPIKKKVVTIPIVIDNSKKRQGQ